MPKKSRRELMAQIGTFSGGLSVVPLAAHGRRSRRRRGRRNRDGIVIPDQAPVEEIAIEVAPHPEHPIVVFSSIGLGDGYQVYVAEGVGSAEKQIDIPDDFRQLSQAEAGVHAIHWVNATTLKYSRDGETVERSIAFSREGSSIQRSSVSVVDDRPLPLTQQHRGGSVSAQNLPNIDIPFPIDVKSANVACTDLPYVQNWCLRVDPSDDGDYLNCDNHNPPQMPHAHFAIYRSREPHSGINIWIGKDGNCIWVGEEHYSNDGDGWCQPLCGPEGGLPSLSTLKDTFEDVIDRSAEAAGIAIPGFVVAALAYYLAGSTLAPPVGVPGI